jgi:hypothetical protein
MQHSAEHHEQMFSANALCTMHTTTGRSSSLEICCKYEQDLKKYDPGFKKINIPDFLHEYTKIFSFTKLSYKPIHFFLFTPVIVLR